MNSPSFGLCRWPCAGANNRAWRVGDAESHENYCEQGEGRDISQDVQGVQQDLRSARSKQVGITMWEVGATAKSGVFLL